MNSCLIKAMSFPGNSDVINLIYGSHTHLKSSLEVYPIIVYMLQRLYEPQRIPKSLWDFKWRVYC